LIRKTGSRHRCCDRWPSRAGGSPICPGSADLAGSVPCYQLLHIDEEGRETVVAASEHLEDIEKAARQWPDRDARLEIELATFEGCGCGG
jgi:hypothetical protein